MRLNILCGCLSTNVKGRHRQHFEDWVGVRSWLKLLCKWLSAVVTGSYLRDACLVCVTGQDSRGPHWGTVSFSSPSKALAVQGKWDHSQLLSSSCPQSMEQQTSFCEKTKSNVLYRFSCQPCPKLKNSVLFIILLQELVYICVGYVCPWCALYSWETPGEIKTYKYCLFDYCAGGRNPGLCSWRQVLYHAASSNYSFVSSCNGSLDWRHLEWGSKE